MLVSQSLVLLTLNTFPNNNSQLSESDQRLKGKFNYVNNNYKIKSYSNLNFGQNFMF